jgi:hypothetical protein
MYGSWLKGLEATAIHIMSNLARQSLVGQLESFRPRLLPSSNQSCDSDPYIYRDQDEGSRHTQLQNESEYWLETQSVENVFERSIPTRRPD